MSAPAAVAVEGLRFRWPGADSFSLAVAALAVAAGERIAVTGASGSGKSTLLRLLAGILAPEAGRIHIAGTCLQSLDADARRRLRARLMGFAFQGDTLLDWLSATDNILYPLRLGHGAVDAAARARAQALAAGFCVDGLLGRKPAALSQGERQRIALARALITRPALVLADEPTASLDPATAAAVLEALLRETTAAGATLILVTHDHGLLPAFDRVIDISSLPA